MRCRWPGLLTCLLGVGPAWGGNPPDTLQRQIAALEARHGGRLGVAALDSGTGRRLEYRSTEPFALCSTFKVILVAAILARIDRHQESLDHSIAYSVEDLLDYAPVARANLSHGSMTVEALCRAAMEYSDNTAANLLLKRLGGPGEVTAFARSLGDSTTRLDRNEPELNSNVPKDLRDTTSPRAMVETLQKVVSGAALSPASRERLQHWMRACSTGTRRLRAGAPASWMAGDKTGTGARGATNDIAVFWPPHRQPIFAVVYFTDSTAPIGLREEALAEVGKMIVHEFATDGGSHTKPTMNVEQRPSFFSR